MRPFSKSKSHLFKFFDCAADADSISNYFEKQPHVFMVISSWQNGAFATLRQHVHLANTISNVSRIPSGGQ